MSSDGGFELWDLKVEVVAPEGAKIWCGANVGDYFELRGEMLHLPPGQGISIYSLASVLPLLAAKQRKTDPNDWMSTDAEIACPDPHCPSRLKITRTKLSVSIMPKPLPCHWETTMQTYDLAPGHRISRVIKGGWQLAGGHGDIDRQTSIEDMIAFADAGITTFDCADIYTGVEALIGGFRKEYERVRGAEALSRIKVHTKFVPDLGKLGTMTKADVVEGIDTSLTRLGMEQLNLVQFHWWDYEIDRQVEVATWLAELRQEGKIANIGGTNFDTEQMLRIIDAGVPLVSMQVQYSLIDDRPSRSMVAAAMEHGVRLLCYGSVGGGLFSERMLGVPELTPPFENRSLVKYKLIVDEFGGWTLFQELLQALSEVAARHGSDIASIASRAVLERPGVAAVIVGARNRNHLDRNLAIPGIELTEQDFAQINAVLARANPVPGDVYTLERDRNGKHGSVMKYNLNKEGH